MIKLTDKKIMILLQKTFACMTNLTLKAYTKLNPLMIISSIKGLCLNKHFESKILFFLPISFNICLGAQKNCLIEAVLLSNHNICFG